MEHMQFTVLCTITLNNRTMQGISCQISNKGLFSKEFNVKRMLDLFPLCGVTCNTNQKVLNYWFFLSKHVFIFHTNWQYLSCYSIKAKIMCKLNIGFFLSRDKCSLWSKLFSQFYLSKIEHMHKYGVMLKLIIKYLKIAYYYKWANLF